MPIDFKNEILTFIRLIFKIEIANARKLINHARIECQSHKLTIEDFGISCLITSFDYDGMPHLFQTDPSVTYLEWKV